MAANDSPPQLVLQQLIQGAQITQCIFVAAKLGLADLLKDGPQHLATLAQMTNTHAPSLFRILRLLAAVDLLTQEEELSFALTPLGSYLQSEIVGSLRNTALFFGEIAWPTWGAALHSVTTGEVAFEQVFGLTFWDYCARHPEIAALFNQTMTEGTASVAPTIATAYDFTASSTLVDVGGGHGQMLASILQAYPNLSGVLFDLPHVVAGAPSLLEAAGVANRCEIVGGDAFTTVPAGYETYLLSRVIHDWDDEHALALLSRCRQAMQHRGKVLLVAERVILSDVAPSLLVLEADTQMLVVAGGKERTDVEFRALFAAAGFELLRLLPVLPPYFLLEAVSI